MAIARVRSATLALVSLTFRWHTLTIFASILRWLSPVVLLFLFLGLNDASLLEGGYDVKLRSGGGAVLWKCLGLGLHSGAGSITSLEGLTLLH